MTVIAAEVFAYGLAAGPSGTALLAVVVVLWTRRGVANAVTLLGGFAVVLIIAVAGAALAVTLLTGQRGEGIVATLVLGLVLLGAAWQIRPGRTSDPNVSAKVASLVAKMHGLQPMGRSGPGSVSPSSPSDSSSRCSRVPPSVPAKS